MTAVELERPTLRRPPPWTASAACQGMAAPDLDPWLADEELPEGQREQLERIAKDVCWGRCTVRKTCLQHALVTGEGSGIWGGLNPAERRALADGDPLLRRPSTAGAWQHGTNAGYAVHGCRCPGCTRAHTHAVAAWRLARRWTSPATGGLTVVVHELHVPSGRGRVKAYPGQLFLDLGAVA